MNVLPVLFENNEILLINKRAGLSVQGGEKVRHPVDELLSKQIGAKVYPVHRLDKDTSGILVVAKNPKAAAKWTQLISCGHVKKQYVALCIGIPQNIDLENAQGKTGAFSTDIGIGKDRRKAFTEYKIKDVALFKPDMPMEEIEFEPFPVSFLELTLGTGRTHQIRIHLAQSGCPIIADDKYGNFKSNKLLRKYVKTKTLQLAANKLTIPINGEATSFEIPLPEHMQTAKIHIFGK